MASAHNNVDESPLQSKAEAVQKQVFTTFENLQHEFRRHDRFGSGRIGQDEFRDVLESFGVVMNDLEFEKLLRAYDPSGTGMVSYLEFSNKVATVVHPSKTGALVVRPKRDGVLRRKRREITTARFAAEVEGKVARHAVQEVAQAAQVFAQYDTDHSGSISRSDFMAAIRRSKLKLRPAEVEALIRACGKGADGRILLVEFSDSLARVLKAATAKAAIAALHQRKKPPTAPVVKLSYEDAIDALQRKLVSRFSSVKKAFRSFDVKGTGQVEYQQFRRVLGEMGVAVSNDDFARLVRDFDPFCLGYVTYIHFNNAIGTVITPGEDGLGVMMNRPTTPVLSEWVGPKWAQTAMKGHNTPEQLFDELDTDHSGAISIPEFIQSMHAHGFNLKPEEAMTLVEMFDRDSTGDVRREEFADTVKRLLKMPTDPHGVPSSMHYAGVTQSAKSVEKMFAHKMFSKFRTVKQAFNMFDEDRSGSVTHEEFRQSLATLGFNLSDFEFDKFVALYDPQGLGEISYQQFQDAVGAVIQPNVVHSRNRRKNFVRPRTPTLAEWWAHKLRGASLAKLDSGIEDAPLTLKGEFGFAAIIAVAKAVGVAITRNEAKRLAVMYSGDPLADTVSEDELRRIFTPNEKPKGEDCGDSFSSRSSQHGGPTRGPAPLRKSATVPSLPKLSTARGSAGMASGRPDTAMSRSSHARQSARRMLASHRSKSSARLSSRRPASALSSVRVDPDLLQEACARVAKQLKGRTMKDAFRVFRQSDPARSSILTKPNVAHRFAAMQVTVLPEDMALFEEQFGVYAPDKTVVRGPKHHIGAASFATKPKRVEPLRGINYVKLLRRVYMEKLNPGGGALVFSPMSTKKRQFWSAAGGASSRRSHASARRSTKASGASRRRADGSAQDTPMSPAPAAARLVTTPPSWPHNVVLGKDDHIESPDSVIFSKVQRLAEQQKAGKAEPVSVSPYKSATATGFNFS